MQHDARMRRLIGPGREPITPFRARVRELDRRWGVSTLLVAGGSSAFLDVADRVILMDRYRAYDVSAEARALAAGSPDPPTAAALSLGDTPSRRLVVGRLARRPDGRARVVAPAADRLLIDGRAIELGRVEQLVEPGQLLAIGHILLRFAAEGEQASPLLVRLRELLQGCERRGLEALSPYPGQPHGGLSLPRLHEVFAACNRLRGP